MKTLLILVAIVGGGYVAYQHFSKPSAAALAYEQYADLMARGKLQEAKAYATGAVLADIEAQLAPPPAPTSTGGSMMGMYQNVMTPQALSRYKSQMISEIAGDITGIKYKIEQDDHDDHAAKLQAVQSVSRYRQGDRLVGGGNVKQFVHHVELIKEGDAWKVSSFKEEVR